MPHLLAGTIPGDAAISSTFGGAVLAAPGEPRRAAEVLDLLGSDAASRIAGAGSMRPARS
ncbi:hypothetical protein [Kitasatospora sp. NPDC093679]|uniref:hypothetical protein n=1 Tax=Kitasatospora sp. NPDC093679 TaxID=3154983 RepID=UPI003440383C